MALRATVLVEPTPEDLVKFPRLQGGGYRGYIREYAARKQIGLVFEPALPDGTLAGARKGSGNFTLTVHGRAAHAGRNPEEGRNALVAAAQAAIALAALNGKRAGVTVNPARLISGGALNVVPDLAVLKWNVRMTQPEDTAWVSAQMEEIVAGLEKDGITATLSGHFTRPPKPMCTRNRALFDWVVESGAMLGQTLSWRDTGGACDGNNLHASGLATVDTLGVRGGYIHSDAEYMVPESLTERAQLATLLLLRLAKGERPQFPS